jgi:N-acetylmuramoyl-L-alanine amidase
MRFRSTLFLLVFAPAVAAASVQVQNIRIWAAPDSTRVVFDLSAPVSHELQLVTDPYRVVIDIRDTVEPPVSAQPQPAPQDKFLRGLRSARRDADLRVVLDLKKFSSAKSFQLPPNERYGHRLVVDLSDERPQETPSSLPPDQEPAADTAREIMIAVDAGHGGDDPGARGPRGTWEKDVVLQVARVLARQIDAEPGLRAVLTREGDYFLPLRKRIELARRHKADLFISVHADAFRDARVRGSSVYVLSERGASSEHARWLAERENASDLIGGVNLDTRDDVLKSVLLDLSQTASLEASIDVAERVLQGLKRIGAVHKRKVESASFAVLKSPDIPSILVETAYISNPEEESRLRSAGHQRALADAIVDGLRGYFLDKAPPGTLLAERRHVIARGDTLSGIAAQYRVSVETLRRANGLRGDIIRTGQTLTIPAGSGG